MGSLCSSCCDSDDISTQDFRNSLQFHDVVNIQDVHNTYCANVVKVHRGYVMAWNPSPLDPRPIFPTSNTDSIVIEFKSKHAENNRFLAGTNTRIRPFRARSCTVCNNSILAGQSLTDQSLTDVSAQATRNIGIPLSLRFDFVLIETIRQHQLWDRTLTTLAEIPYDSSLHSNVTMVVDGRLSSAVQINGCNFVLNHGSCDLTLVTPWQLRQQIESVDDEEARMLDLKHCQKLIIDLPQALARSRQALEDAKKEENVELSQLGALLLEIDRIQQEIDIQNQKLPQLKTLRVTEIRIIRPFIKLQDGLNVFEDQVVYIYRDLTIQQIESLKERTLVIDYLL